MKTVVFFLEGKSEVIFIRKVLISIFPTDIKITIQRIGINESFEDVYSSYQIHCEHARIHFILYDAANDIRVLSIIRSNAPAMLSKGYYVYGLRDMFSSVYSEESNGKINNAVTNKTIQSIEGNLQTIYNGNDNRLKMFFSVMEIEAWYLGLTTVLSLMGIDINKAGQILSLDLLTIDPEKIFFKPKTKLKLIYENITSNNYDEVKFANKMCKYLTKEHLELMSNSGKNSHFKKLYSTLVGL